MEVKKYTIRELDVVGLIVKKPLNMLGIKDIIRIFLSKNLQQRWVFYTGDQHPYCISETHIIGFGVDVLLTEKIDIDKLNYLIDRFWIGTIEYGVCDTGFLLHFDLML